MQPLDIRQTTEDISVARLSSYHHFFPGISAQEAYGLYCWNEAISAALFRLISITEIAMRNRFHIELSRYSHATYGAAVMGREDANDWYEHISLAPKSMEKIRKVTHRRRGRNLEIRRPPPSPNDVVSQMTFGFWPALLNMGALPWGTLLPLIMKGHRYRTAAHWGKERNQDQLWARMDLVNQLRNRIAHFEPVWKQGPLREERRPRRGRSRPAVVIPAPASPAEALSMLKVRHDRTAELLRWFSPDRLRDYQQSYMHDHFQWLCSDHGLNAYRRMVPGHQLPLSRFKRELNSIARRGEMVKVRQRGVIHGSYYPW